MIIEEIAKKYEQFIRRAFNCKRDTTFGASSHVFISLCSTSKAIPMDFLRLKIHLENAISTMYDKELTEDEIKSFDELKSQLDESDTIEEIFKVVEKGYELTARFFRDTI